MALPVSILYHMSTVPLLITKGHQSSASFDRVQYEYTVHESRAIALGCKSPSLSAPITSHRKSRHSRYRDSPMSTRSWTPCERDRFARVRVLFRTLTHLRIILVPVLGCKSGHPISSPKPAFPCPVLPCSFHASFVSSWHAPTLLEYSTTSTPRHARV